MVDLTRFEELCKHLDNLHVNASYVSPTAGQSANLLGSAIAELAACYTALEPFARMYRWTRLPSADDDAQVLWRKHWLTGEKMKLITEHFRLAALAFYHGGILPDGISGEQELAIAMADEIERWNNVRALRAALDEFGVE